MKQTVLVTGASGFIGQNLVQQLRHRGDFEVIEVGRSSSQLDLEKGLKVCDVVVHLAGTNRPQSEASFDQDNVGFTSEIVTKLETISPRPLIFASSTQALLDNAYGRSKRAAELIIGEYSVKNNVPVRILRLPNVFGKWARPHYNSVVATFVHEVLQGRQPMVLEPSRELELLYIDDLVELLIVDIKKNCDSKAFPKLPTYRVTVQELSNLISQIHWKREKGEILDVGSGLLRALYATYISALEPRSFTYPLTPKTDFRGSFVEILKTESAGQISAFVATPGSTRGSHFHHSKVEKFIVVSGIARFRFRHLLNDKQFETIASSELPVVVESIPGWIHDVTNLGEQDLVVIVWASEVFRKDRADTFQGALNDQST